MESELQWTFLSICQTLNNSLHGPLRKCIHPFKDKPKPIYFEPRPCITNHGQLIAHMAPESTSFAMWVSRLHRQDAESIPLLLNLGWPGDKLCSAKCFRANTVHRSLWDSLSLLLSLSQPYHGEMLTSPSLSAGGMWVASCSKANHPRGPWKGSSRVQYNRWA